MRPVDLSRPNNESSPTSSKNATSQPTSFIAPVEIGFADGFDVQSAIGTASVVGSIAHTVAFTVVDGIVHSIAHWKVLLLGQVISLLLAIAGGTNEVLSLECGISIPSTYNAFGYFLLAIVGGIAFKKEAMKTVNQNSDEQRSFSGNGPNDNCADQVDYGYNDEDGDDITVDDESQPRRIFSSYRHQNNDYKSRGQRDKIRSKIISNPGDVKKPLEYPFLCGFFTIHAKWYHYFAVALIEAQAFFFIFLAFRYTSFTFVYVSDALAIPSSMIFTRIIMKKRYSWTHLIGGAVCMGGIIVNTASDMHEKDSMEHISPSDHLKGDLFAILGAVLLGLDDVLSEILVTDFGGVNEMLFMKGFYGTIISIAQLLFFDIDGARRLFGIDEGSSCDVSSRMALFFGHIATRALSVAGEMQFLYLSEAALLNLSLLTSDLYAAIFDVIRIGLQLPPLFFLAISLVFAGIILYEAGPSPNHYPTSTPLGIEIHQGRRTLESLTSMNTEHAGNLSKGAHSEAELT